MRPDGAHLTTGEQLDRRNPDQQPPNDDGVMVVVAAGPRQPGATVGSGQGGVDVGPDRVEVVRQRHQVLGAPEQVGQAGGELGAGADRGLDRVGELRRMGGRQRDHRGGRVAAARGAIVVTGVEIPRRFEWTPLYFKEIAVIGSNAFGVEEMEGRARHSMEIYLDLVRSRRIDATAIITHRFSLDAWREAFLACGEQGASGAVKVLFTYPR